MVSKFKKSNHRESTMVDTGPVPESSSGTSATVTNHEPPGAIEAESTGPALEAPTTERAFQFGTRQPASVRSRTGADSPARIFGAKEVLAEAEQPLLNVLEKCSRSMESHVEQTAEILRLLERFRSTIPTRDDLATTRKELLADVRELSKEGTAQRRKLVDEIAELPKLADAQRETMVSISRQLELVRDTCQQMTKATADAQSSQAKLADAVQHSYTCVQQLVTIIKERDERLERQWQERSKQVSMWVWILLTVLSVIALTNLIALF